MKVSLKNPTITVSFGDFLAVYHQGAIKDYEGEIRRWPIGYDSAAVFIQDICPITREITLIAVDKETDFYPETET